MPEPQELNELLKDKKITSIEPGTTPGWMVINFEPEGIVAKHRPGDRVFLTVFVGGRKGSYDAEYFSTCALHRKGEDGRGTAYMIRDGRDPEMPMASAKAATGRVRTCNYEFEYEGEIDRCGSTACVHGLCEAHYKQLITPSDPIAEAEQALKQMRAEGERL